MSRGAGLRWAVAWGLPLAAAALGVCALVATVLGARAVPVLTGSMAPALPPGALAVVTPIEPGHVRPGQVVVFRPPPDWPTADDRPVVHRVVSIDPSGPTATMRTKGDANPSADPWTVALDGRADLGLSHGHVPHLGHAVAGGRLGLALVLLGVLGLTVLHGRTGPPRPAGCTCAG